MTKGVHPRPIDKPVPPHPAPHDRHETRHPWLAPPQACCRRWRLHPIHINRWRNR